MPLFVTVTPGTTITNSTTLDATVLNLLGTPAIDVTGTVDGGSLSLSAGSVGTNELSDNAVTNAKLADMTGPSVKGRQTGTGDPENVTIDNSTVEIATVSSSPTLRVKDTGISYAKIQNTVNGKRLIGRAGTAGGVVGEIEVGTGLNLSDGGILTATNTYAKFTNPSAFGVPNSGDSPTYQKKIAHNLSGQPSLFRVYAMWLGGSPSAAGFVAGQQVTVESFFGNGFRGVFTCWADTTYIYLSRASYLNEIFGNRTNGGNYIDLQSEFDAAASNWTFAVEAVRFI